jgi:hypothetical protein
VRHPWSPAAGRLHITGGLLLVSLCSWGKLCRPSREGWFSCLAVLLLHKPDLSDDMQDLPLRFRLSCEADLDCASSIIQHYNPLHTHGPRGP